MSNQWIYDKVNDLVKTYQTRDPEQLIMNLNIQLKIIPATESLLGMYRVILKKRFIFLPCNVGNLKRTVLAHEIGHDQLHRRECLKGASFHENRVFNPTNRYELEANIFAAHLLIPDAEVLHLIGSAQNDRELADELEVDINLLNLKISEMAKMKLLDLDSGRLQRPKSEFLKDYRPSHEDWSEC